DFDGHLSLPTMYWTDRRPRGRWSSLNGGLARMTQEMSKIEKQALEAMQGARREGLSLRAYAQKHGLKVPNLYNTIARLRHKGLLGKRAGKRRGKSVTIRGEITRANPPPSDAQVSHE